MNRQLLAAKMLKLAADKFSRNICNDLSSDVKELITSELCNDIGKWSGDSKDTWPENEHHIPDWMLMSYLSDKLRDETIKIK